MCISVYPHGCMYTTYMYGALRSQTEYQIFQNWSYRQLCANMWVLGTKPGSSAKAVSAVDH